jgi:bifunctional non-homologous end joining protein LigD
VPNKLETYKAKRDFKTTPEPAGAEAEQSEQPRFVVQEHHARRLHWDLRLEHDGALASWAIPNGIPQEPKENRKAVRTEDHPLEYLDFHGEIPKGEYGAGTMTIWDRGTYECETWNDKKVTVVFHGEKLRGRYALFRTGDASDWMIHRMDPAEPGREPMPEHIVPMMAKLANLPREEERFGFEIKWDGVRAIAYMRPGRIHLESRNLLDITAQYPELRGLTGALGSHETVLDGEIVAFDSEGRPSFERLQQRMHQTSESVIRRRMKSHPVTYVIFDLLYLDGHSLMEEPYTERRRRLEELELDGDHWQTPAYSPGNGKALLQATVEKGLEGLVAKRLDSRYEPGKRGGAWLKIKNKASQELVIGGWEPGEGRRRDRIGALLLGFYEEGQLRYAGKVGTGFTEKTLDDLARRLKPLERKTSPFSGLPPPPRRAIFVEPELVAEIEFTEWTPERMLRHPSFKGLREDKEAEEVVAEQVQEAAIERVKELADGKVLVRVEGRELKLSNLDKVLYPKTGFTKGDLIDFYVRIAPVLLPHLHGRPLTLKRYPDGVEGQHFYEKRCPAHRPDWVQTASIWSDRHGKEIDYCLAQDLPTLVWLANLADIELHTSLSMAEEMQRPTAMVFDLDPGEPADIVDCCQVGVWIRGMLGQLGLESHAKVSGSKGLQVYVPLNSEETYDQTKPFAKAVAETLEKQFPDRVVSRMTKKIRPGKVLVDWSQNDDYKTTVSVYSLRARERPTVSAPVRWEEVEAVLESEDRDSLVFEAGRLLERVDEEGDLFAPVLTRGQELPEL